MLALRGSRRGKSGRKENGPHRRCAAPGAREAPAPRLTVGARLPVIIWGYEIFGRRRRLPRRILAPAVPGGGRDD
ncbi:hypothetical protein CBM2592_A120077 [Cupriavidus taiwanensis]|nr:hypothetical protein CBM2592_A120077 [Cupriavidus taiwanensis]SOY59296.1 hypothetical protein CBM2588_A90077 [Cupriavidus taiwanensis]SOZ51469.1 hypothetical protein CBM2617_A120077 [Cupriavidus taiwanensis]SOZ76348.1 hypothetical protein CBM2622_A120077 [Cupriavidus taiwanensis]SOZ76839.1 hypothetical protein CBM2618_A120077 [Cupriavidus taiwanensis]